MLINAFFSELNHAEGLMNVEQSIKSKTLKVITSENKTVIMLDHFGNQSKVFDMEEVQEKELGGGQKKSFI